VSSPEPKAVSWCTHVGYICPQEVFAKFEYRSKRKIEKFK